MAKDEKPTVVVTFERTQRQTVNVPVPPGIKPETAQDVARQLARGLLRPGSWEDVKPPAIVEGK